MRTPSWLQMWSSGEYRRSAIRAVRPGQPGIAHRAVRPDRGVLPELHLLELQHGAVLGPEHPGSGKVTSAPEPWLIAFGSVPLTNSHPHTTPYAKPPDRAVDHP